AAPRLPRVARADSAVRIGADARPAPRPDPTRRARPARGPARALPGARRDHREPPLPAPEPGALPRAARGVRHRDRAGLRMRGAAVALLLLATAASAGRFDAYFAELESPDRAGWQQPARVVETLRLRAGMTVADVGAGTGYFARRFAAAVGPTGKVLALDTEPEMLEELRRRAPDATTIETRRVEPDDPRLAPASVDLIFICNTGHHLTSGCATTGSSGARSA